MSDPTNPSTMPVGLRILERDLPVFPSLALRTLRLLQDPSVDNRHFARLLDAADDLKLADRILRVANSAYYAPRAPIRDVSDAVARLGRRSVYDLIIVAAVGGFYDSHDPYVQKLWNHAIATGIASLTLAKTYCQERLDEAFVAGVLHDIGKLVVYMKYPFLYWRYWYELGTTHCRLDKIEMAEFPDMAHTTVGWRVIRKWNLADPIAEAAYLHHKLEAAVPVHRDDFILQCIVSLSNVIVNNLGINAPVCSWPRTEALACARLVNFDLHQVGTIRDQLEEVFAVHGMDLFEAPASVGHPGQSQSNSIQGSAPCTDCPA